MNEIQRMKQGLAMEYGHSTDIDRGIKPPNKLYFHKDCYPSDYQFTIFEDEWVAGIKTPLYWLQEENQDEYMELFEKWLTKKRMSC